MTCPSSRPGSERTARLRPLIRGPAQYTRPDPLGRVASLGQDGRFGSRRPVPVRRLDRAPEDRTHGILTADKGVPHAGKVTTEASREETRQVAQGEEGSKARKEVDQDRSGSLRHRTRRDQRGLLPASWAASARSRRIQPARSRRDLTIVGALGAVVSLIAMVLTDAGRDGQLWTVDESFLQDDSYV